MPYCCLHPIYLEYLAFNTNTTPILNYNSELFTTYIQKRKNKKLYQILHAMELNIVQNYINIHMWCVETVGKPQT